LTAARTDRLYARYAVAISLGLRRGEALGLRWQDVDLVDGVPRVRQTLQRLGGNSSRPRHFLGLLDRAGVRRFRFHDLRHSCATLLYEQGVEIAKIYGILGHNSPTDYETHLCRVTRRASAPLLTS
jgi:integrase